MGRDSLVDVLVEGLQEQNRLKIMDEVKEVHRGGQSRGGEDRRLGEELGGDQSGRARLQQRRFPQAAVREAVDELTLRREEEGMLRTFIDTTNVGDSRWRPPMVDAGWHAICQTIYRGRRGSGMGEVVL